LSNSYKSFLFVSHFQITTQLSIKNNLCNIEKHLKVNSGFLNRIEMKSCPECGSKNICWDNGSGLLCKKCGLVIDESIYSGERPLV
jgi:ribosomal protein S27E